MSTKFLKFSTMQTDDFIKHLDKETKVLIIAVGDSTTKVPSTENIVYVHTPMLDEEQDKRSLLKEQYKSKGYNEFDLLRETKFQIIDFVFALRDKFDVVIVRCDAGQMRSGAIATSLERKYGVKFEHLNHCGNRTILKEFMDFLKIENPQTTYDELFSTQDAYVENVRKTQNTSDWYEEKK